MRRRHLTLAGFDLASARAYAQTDAANYPTRPIRFFGSLRPSTTA